MIRSGLYRQKKSDSGDNFLLDAPLVYETIILKKNSKISISKKVADFSVSQNFTKNAYFSILRKFPKSVGVMQLT